MNLRSSHKSIFTRLEDRHAKRLLLARMPRMCIGASVLNLHCLCCVTGARGHKGSWGSPALASGHGCPHATPAPRQCFLGQSPLFCMEMGPGLPGTVDRRGAAEPPGSQFYHSLPPPHPATWAMVESPKFVSGDCFLHHLPL